MLRPLLLYGLVATTAFLNGPPKAKEKWSKTPGPSRCSKCQTVGFVGSATTLSAREPSSLSTVEELEGLSTRPNCELQGEKIANLLGSKSLGVDWGVRRIGLAVSAGFSQSPLRILPNKAGGSRNFSDHLPMLDEILRMAKVQGAARIVVGMPYYRNGTMSPQGEASLQYARWLANRAVQLGMIPSPSLSPPDSPKPRFLYMWDERLTSQIAMAYIMTGELAFTSKTMDAEAACLVLQDFYREGGAGSYIVYPDSDIEDGSSDQTSVAVDEDLQKPEDALQQARLRLQQQILRQRQQATAPPSSSSSSIDSPPQGTSSKKKKKKKK